MVGIDYKSSPIEVREKFAFSSSDYNTSLRAFRDQIGPVVLLSTCNRTEIYLSCEHSQGEVKAKALQLFAKLKDLDHNFVAEHTNFLAGQEVLKHLFRVSAGLESMILGEGQILNQVKNAYGQSQGSTDALLNQLFQRALAVGKKVRANTEISRGAMSVPSAAMQSIQKLIFPGELAEKKIMVLGSGQVAQLCLELLHSQGAGEHITLVNRSPDNHGLSLVKYGISHNISYGQLQSQLQSQEIVLVCTSAPHFVITPELFEQKTKKVIICDMSLPRNVDPEVRKLAFVNLIDLDYLNETVAKNLTQRSAQTEEAQEILQKEIIRFDEWLLGAEKYQSSSESSAVQS
jgi:glutamyl-tRNA reductase